MTGSPPLGAFSSALGTRSLPIRIVWSGELFCGDDPRSADLPTFSTDEGGATIGKFSGSNRERAELTTTPERREHE